LERRTRAARERRRLKEGSNSPNEAAVRLKEGSTAPLRLNARVPSGGGVPSGDGAPVGNEDALAVGANEDEIDVQSEQSDGDGLSDGDGNSVGSDVGLRRSSRSRAWPDRLTYQQLGGIACRLAYSFIAQPKPIMAALYQKFQALNFDSSSDTIEDELPYSLMVQASEKDDRTWCEARMSNEYGKF